MLNFVVFILNIKILYKEDTGPGTTIEKTPEMQRVKRTQDAISSVQKILFLCFTSVNPT